MKEADIVHTTLTEEQKRVGDAASVILPLLADQVAAERERLMKEAGLSVGRPSHFKRPVERMFTKDDRPVSERSWLAPPALPRVRTINAWKERRREKLAGEGEHDPSPRTPGEREPFHLDYYDNGLRGAIRAREDGQTNG